jgi:GNAT superfamily N-acetyltransferase
MSTTPRQYQGADDLPLLLRFASICTAQRSPLFSSWHPGDVVWELHASAHQPQPNRFWVGANGVELMAWNVGPGEVWLEALPSAEPLVADAVRWAEDHWGAKRGEEPTLTLSIRCYDRDAARIRTLEALGYHKAKPEGVVFRLPLDDRLPERDAPAGFCVRDCVGVDPIRRAEAHRAAWNHLEHLGIDAQSRFTTEAYLSLTSLPAYEPALDILARAPDGEFAANCIAWADEPSGVAVFEPVGTSLPFRGRRLARLVISEALRRLKARGMREARVGTAHFNGAAIAAYLSCGFEIADTAHWWSKAVT